MKGETDRCCECHSHSSKAAADSCMSPYAYSSALCFLELGCQSEPNGKTPGGLNTTSERADATDLPLLHLRAEGKCSCWQVANHRSV